MKKILFLFLTGMVLLACSTCAESEGEKKAPDFSLRDLNNKVVRLSNYKGKVVVLDFFATWCPPCRAEIPEFVELVNDYGDKNLAIIGISIERGENIKALKQFANDYKINYPTLVDDGIVSVKYGPISGIPTTFIIDKKGNIVEKIIGARKKAYFEKILVPLL